MSDFFQHGEIVTLTIKRARVLEVKHYGDSNGACLKFEYDLPGGTTLSDAVFIDAEGVTVERIAPAEWPPTPGDLWRGPKSDDPYGPDPIIWFARRDRDLDGGNEKLELIPADGDLSYVSTNPEQVRRDFGPLTLVYREEARDDR